jgi:putative RecB family exonuclease
VITLSASKLTTYLQCPRRYKFRYVSKIPPPWKASALALGSAVHGALETFHQQRAEHACMTPEAVWQLFQIDLAAELALDDIKYKDDETADDLVATGTTLVRMYAAANQNVAVKAAEVPFELEVVRGIGLRGVFDALLDNNKIRELKTAARDYDEANLWRNVQLSCYAWAFRALFGIDATIEVVAMLKQKYPRIETHEVTRTAAQTAWFVQLVIEVAEAIEARVFPPNPSYFCATCEYAERCAAMGGGP